MTLASSLHPPMTLASSLHPQAVDILGSLLASPNTLAHVMGAIVGGGSEHAMDVINERMNDGWVGVTERMSANEWLLKAMCA